MHRAIVLLALLMTSLCADDAPAWIGLIPVSGAQISQANTWGGVQTISVNATNQANLVVSNTGTNGSGINLTNGTSNKFIRINPSSSTLAFLNSGYTSSIMTLDDTGNLSPAGNVDVTTAGSGLKVKEGSNAKQGTATLVAGTVAVSNTSVTSTSRIFLTIQSPGGTVGSVYVSARTAGTSFTITSTSGSDTSTVAYEIFEGG